MLPREHIHSQSEADNKVPSTSEISLLTDRSISMLDLSISKLVISLNMQFGELY